MYAHVYGIHNARKYVNENETEVCVLRSRSNEQFHNSHQYYANGRKLHVCVFFSFKFNPFKNREYREIRFNHRPNKIAQISQ